MHLDRSPVSPVGGNKKGRRDGPTCVGGMPMTARLPRAPQAGARARTAEPRWDHRPNQTAASRSNQFLLPDWSSSFLCPVPSPCQLVRPPEHADPLGALEVREPWCPGQDESRNNRPGRSECRSQLVRRWCARATQRRLVHATREAVEVFSRTEWVSTVDQDRRRADEMKPISILLCLHPHEDRLNVRHALGPQRLPEHVMH